MRHLQPTAPKSELERLGFVMNATKEELVRQRLANEAHLAEEQAQHKTEQRKQRALARQTEFDSLMTAMDEEAVRLAGIFENADWSKAELVSFTDVTKGRHWWNRTKVTRTEYALLKFIEVKVSQPCRSTSCYSWHPTYWSTLDGYVRSDGVLFFKERLRYLVPHQYFGEKDNDETQQALDYVKQCHTPEIRAFVIEK